MAVRSTRYGLRATFSTRYACQTDEAAAEEDEGAGDGDGRIYGKMRKLVVRELGGKGNDVTDSASLTNQTKEPAVSASYFPKM